MHTLTSHPKKKQKLLKKKIKFQKKKTLIKIEFTFSSFSKESALRGNQPWMASPATALSHAGQPAATCSPSTYFCKLPNLKLTDSLPHVELTLPESPRLTEPVKNFFFSESVGPTRLRPEPVPTTALSRKTPE
uniref:Uncharacterized protein n=1 Tax=Opuntia streptacantha TaxID=393608 RepID=A0A7C8Z7J8_OPUST